MLVVTRRRSSGKFNLAMHSPEDSQHGRVEKIFAPCTGTGALATGELADYQPHVDDYIACAQLKPAA